MPGTLTTWRTAVLSLLDDPSNARYTNDQVDAAIRQALQAYNVTRPFVRTYSIAGTGNYQITMPADFLAERITEVFLDNDDDPPTPITFYAFRKDEQWVIQTTRYVVPTDKNIYVTYADNHILDGLDSGAGTTIPAADEYAVQIGAAGYALASRAASRAESINMQPAVTAQLLSLSKVYLAQFTLLTRPHASPTFTQTPDLKGGVF
jgi:hypothetical protein